MDITEIKERIEELKNIKKKTPKENSELKRLQRELSDLENADENVSIDKSLFSTSKGQEVKYLNIFDIKDNPYQPRKLIDEDEIDDLADSIEELGKLLQPISVAIFESELYLNVGQKRLKAFKKLYEKEKNNNPQLEDFESKYLKIFSVTIEVTSLEELSDMALTENLARSNPFIIDTALAMKENFELHRDKDGVTQTDYTKMAQKKFGIKSKGTISKYFKIATLEDEIVDRIRETRFNSLTKLYYIAKSELSIEEKLNLLELASKDEMSLKDFENLSKSDEINSNEFEDNKEEFPQETNSNAEENSSKVESESESNEEEEEFPQETNQEKPKKQKVDTVYVLNTLKNIKETTPEDKDRLIDELIEYLDNI
jgi:ParB-like chromosome segregation protein Spo0J